MSESYPENPRGVRQRVSRWSTTRRGTKTLKAAYAQAARDVKRMDPSVREAIGRSNMTRADLQQLASLHVDAQFRPDRYGDVSQRLGAEAAARTNPARGQTRNPLRRVANRYSRWQDRRQGTKALKAAFTQAARDVKRTDPQVRWAIGRSQINQADLAALASSRMDQVFRPEGRFQNVPGQQNQTGAGRPGQGQGQGVQSPDAVRQAPSPQQSEQMNQRIAALQQAILESQQQTLALMEENNRLQAQMRQLLEARVQQLQQENAADPALEPGQQREGTNQLEAGDQQPDERRTEGEADRGEPRTEGEPQAGEPRAAGEAEVGEAGEPRAVGEQAGTGERPAGEAQVGDDNGPQVGEGGEPQTPQAVAEVEGVEAPNPAEDWTVSSETQGESVRSGEAQEGRQPTGELSPPAAHTQSPAPTVDPQQASTDPQQPGTNPQQPRFNVQPQRGPAAGEKTSADVDAKFARDIAFNGSTPLNSVSPEQSGKAVKEGGDDANRRQRGGQAPTRNGPTGREGG